MNSTEMEMLNSVASFGDKISSKWRQSVSGGNSIFKATSWKYVRFRSEKTRCGFPFRRTFHIVINTTSTNTTTKRPCGVEYVEGPDLLRAQPLLTEVDRRCFLVSFHTMIKLCAVLFLYTLIAYAGLKVKSKRYVYHQNTKYCKKTSNLALLILCELNPQVTRGFSSQRGNNTESVASHDVDMSLRLYLLLWCKLNKNLRLPSQYQI